MDRNGAVSVVEKLIETCRDGQKGYTDAAEPVKRPDLKIYFQQQSVEPGHFAEELEQESHTEAAKQFVPCSKDNVPRHFRVR
jgi:uncharacterized protein DUF2383